MESVSPENISALRCAKNGKFIYTYAGYISINGRMFFSSKNIKQLLDAGFMCMPCVWTVEITDKGESFIDSYEGNADCCRR